MTISLFVYGTLKRHPRSEAHRLLQSARLVGRASISGALYDLGAYPGLVRGGRNGSRVTGELYELPLSGAARMLRELDRYEGREFDRRRAFVTLASGRRRGAWVYVPRARPGDRARLIRNGQYTHRITNRSRVAEDEILPEYDFSDARRNPYAAGVAKKQSPSRHGRRRLG